MEFPSSSTAYLLPPSTPHSSTDELSSASEDHDDDTDTDTDTVLELGQSSNKGHKAGASSSEDVGRIPDVGQKRRKRRSGHSMAPQFSSTLTTTDLLANLEHSSQSSLDQDPWIKQSMDNNGPCKPYLFRPIEDHTASNFQNDKGPFVRQESDEIWLRRESPRGYKGSQDQLNADQLTDPWRKRYSPDPWNTEQSTGDLADLASCETLETQLSLSASNLDHLNKTKSKSVEPIPIVVCDSGKPRSRKQGVWEMKKPDLSELKAHSKRLKRRRGTWNGTRSTMRRIHQGLDKLKSMTLHSKIKSDNDISKGRNEHHTTRLMDAPHHSRAQSKQRYGNQLSCPGDIPHSNSDFSSDGSREDIRPPRLMRQVSMPVKQRARFRNYSPLYDRRSPNKEDDNATDKQVWVKRTSLPAIHDVKSLRKRNSLKSYPIQEVPHNEFELSQDNRQENWQTKPKNPFIRRASAPIMQPTNQRILFPDEYMLDDYDPWARRNNSDPIKKRRYGRYNSIQEDRRISISSPQLGRRSSQTHRSIRDVFKLHKAKVGFLHGFATQKSSCSLDTSAENLKIQNNDNTQEIAIEQDTVSDSDTDHGDQLCPLPSQDASKVPLLRRVRPGSPIRSFADPIKIHRMITGEAG